MKGKSGSLGVKLMNRLKQELPLIVVVVLLAIPALAQTPAPTPEEARNAQYRSFAEKVSADPAGAYTVGKEFINKYPTPDDQYLQYVKRWVSAYEDRLASSACADALKSNKAEAFTTCKPLAEKNPDNLNLMTNLANTGVNLTGNDRKTHAAEGAGYARKAIQLVNAGKTFEANKPLPNKELLLASLNYIVGNLSLETDPGEAAKALIAAAKSESDYKKAPAVYALLSEAYRRAEYDKLREEIVNKCGTAEQQETPECKTLNTKVNDVTDRMIDALARAVAYAATSTDASAKTASATWKQTLKSLYAFRKGSEDGMDAYIAGVTAKPLP
jgi:hypothetical protein